MAQEDKEPLQTAMTIAVATGLPYPFFIKIANQLKRGNLVDAIQGRNGGYMIGKPAEEISVYDVFLATEGELQIHGCLKGEGTQCQQDGCSLRSFFGDIQEAMIEKMAAQNIRDLGYLNVS